MVEAQCGFFDDAGTPGRDRLVITGPTILVDTGWDPGYNAAAPGAIPRAAVKGAGALVDTGATECCIDYRLAKRLSLPVLGRRTFAGASGLMDTSLYAAQLYVPALAWVVWGEFAGVDLAATGQGHQALIGRTFLRWFTMTYSGPTGDVRLRSGPFSTAARN